MISLPQVTYVYIDGRKNKNLSDIILYAEYANKNINFGKYLILSPDASKYKHEYIEFNTIPELNYIQYSKFIVEELYRYINTDFILTYQEDGAIYKPDLWSNDFLNYDYIGAPWHNNQHEWIKNKNFVGNGGFSLRSKKFLQTSSLLKFQKKGKMQYEDIFLTCLNRNFLEKNNIKISDINIARRFSIELPIDNTHTKENCFGFHTHWSKRKNKNYIEWYKQHINLI